MAQQGWSFTATPEDPSISQPALKLFWSIVERDQDRARRRYLRARRMEPDQELDVWVDEPLRPEPSDREAIPAEPVGSSLALPAQFHLLGSQDPRPTVQCNLNSLCASTSKRPGEPLDASPDKEKRASKDPEDADLDVNVADFGIPSGNDNDIRLNVTGADRGSAVDSPTAGGPSFRRPFNSGGVARLTDETFNTVPPS